MNFGFTENRIKEIVRSRGANEHATFKRHNAMAQLDNGVSKLRNG
jgi:hypothetical protein